MRYSEAVLPSRKSSLLGVRSDEVSQNEEVLHRTNELRRRNAEVIFEFDLSARRFRAKAEGSRNWGL